MLMRFSCHGDLASSSCLRRLTLLTALPWQGRQSPTFFFCVLSLSPTTDSSYAKGRIVFLLARDISRKTNSRQQGSGDLGRGNGPTWAVVCARLLSSWGCIEKLREHSPILQDVNTICNQRGKCRYYFRHTTPTSTRPPNEPLSKAASFDAVNHSSQKGPGGIGFNNECRCVLAGASNATFEAKAVQAYSPRPLKKMADLPTARYKHPTYAASPLLNN